MSRRPRRRKRRQPQRRSAAAAAARAHRRALIARRRSSSSAATLGGEAAFGSRCDLNALRPVAVGQNSFVYAANGSELGVIPAEHNRTPVAGAADQPVGARGDGRDRGPALLRSTAASTRSASCAPSSPTCAPGRSCRAARRSRRSSSATSTSRAQRTLQRKLTEACLAIKLGQTVVEGPDPDRVPQRGVLRQPRVRHRGRGRDVLLRAGAAADARRRPRCSPDCRRRRRSTTRSSGPTTRSRAATRCCTRCSSTATSRASSTRRARADRSLHLKPGPPLHRDPRAVLLQLRRGPAPAGVRHEHRSRGRPEGVHDDRPGPAARGDGGGHARAERVDRSRRRRSSPSTRRAARSAR